MVRVEANLGIWGIHVNDSDCPVEGHQGYGEQRVDAPTHQGFRRGKIATHENVIAADGHTLFHHPLDDRPGRMTEFPLEGGRKFFSILAEKYGAVIRLDGFENQLAKPALESIEPTDGRYRLAHSKQSLQRRAHRRAFPAAGKLHQSA